MKAVLSEGTDWNGLKCGDEVDVVDNGLVIARGVVEDVEIAQGILRLELSYGKGKRVFLQEDGWEVRAARRDHIVGR